MPGHFHPFRIAARTGAVARILVVAAALGASANPGFAQAVTAAAGASPAPEIPPVTTPASQGSTAAAPGPGETPLGRGLGTRALDAMRSAAQGAQNIFSRVPCARPRKVTMDVSLPHVARRLAARETVTIVAFGSSTTNSHGASSPVFYYPNRLADQLRRHYPDVTINVVTKGVGGEDVPEMMRRIQPAVLDQHPDLVIWQLGTNAVVQGRDFESMRAQIEDGIRQMQAIGADVVLVDPQYVPATEAKAQASSRMVGLISRIANSMKVGVFPRFEVMKSWRDDQSLPFDSFVINDGLHMNDWGYACFAQLLGDSIIRSVDQIKAGLGTAGNENAVLTYRPL